jgi:RHS repeat-associated protein
VAHSGGSLPTESYTYDSAGNRRTEGMESGFTYDAANRLTQDPDYDYAYDAAGNLVSKTHRSSGAVTTYAYSAENRLEQVSLPGGASVAFKYDPLGRLALKQTAASTYRYVYDQDQTLAVFNGSGSLIRRYLNGSAIDRQWGVIIGGIGGDHYITPVSTLGSIDGYIETDGSFQTQILYEAFGTPHPDGAMVDERLFAGRDYDAASGLYYLRNRFYDPASGRFLQPDPMPALAATAPYIYAANSPTNYRDPFGLDPASNPSQAEALGNMLNKRVLEPAVNRGIEEGLGRLGDVPNALNPSIVPLPGIGTVGRTAWTQYNQWKDIISVFGSANPLEAGIRWYSSQPWNPARHYIDDFLTMGGQLERRQARIRPICGLFNNLGLIGSRNR